MCAWDPPVCFFTKISTQLSICRDVSPTTSSHLPHTQMHTHVQVHTYIHCASLLAPSDIARVFIWILSFFPTRLWVLWDQGLWFIMLSIHHSFWYKSDAQHVYCKWCNKPDVNQEGLAYRMSHLPFTQVLRDLSWQEKMCYNFFNQTKDLFLKNCFSCQ